MQTAIWTLHDYMTSNFDHTQVTGLTGDPVMILHNASTPYEGSNGSISFKKQRAIEPNNMHKTRHETHMIECEAYYQGSNVDQVIQDMREEFLNQLDTNNQNASRTYWYEVVDESLNIFGSTARMPFIVRAIRMFVTT